jgi:REP element-mobilizing transposase RayT
MARLPRNETEPGIHHVFARGVERRVIFVDDEDRQRYLWLLRAVAQKFRWHCLAYCLMPNHVHLLIETTEPNLGRGMHSLHGLYAQTFNERFARVGHLFQSRFGSRPVHDDLGLMRVAAYIEVNPVAANLCSSPEDWDWSSYRRVVAGKNGRVPDLDRLRRHIAPNADLAAVYCELVRGALLA